MNYLAPLLTFLGTLLFCHIVFIKWRPQKKLFWKKVDYFWISLGIIGIIGATFSLRKEYALASMPYHEEVLELVYDNYVQDIERQKSYFSDAEAYYYESDMGRDRAEHFIAAGIFFDSLQKFTKNINLL